MTRRESLLEFFKNVSYTFSSNILSLIISTVVVLIVPKFIGVESYGYWQLYIFYTSFVGFLHFGWNDGIYLRMGGERFDKLDRSTYYSQFYMMLGFQCVLACLTLVFAYLYPFNNDKRFILTMTALCMIITNTRYMLLYVLQATYKIKEYSTITISDRVIYILIIVAILFLRIKDYRYMVFADIVGKVLSFIYAIYVCRRFLFLSLSEFKFDLKEVCVNIKVGIKLMFSNIASKLVIGNVRFGIENVFAIAVFAQISLTLSISSFLMIFISAVGLVLFPFLRRMDDRKLTSIYTSIRSLLMVFLFGALLLYFPLKMGLDSWLPKYKDSLKYLAFLFPMCVYEGRMSLLVNTYLKVLRKEGLLLKINIITVIFSLILTGASIYILKNVDLAVLSILVLVAIRCVMSEIFLEKIIQVGLLNDFITEGILTIIFVIAVWYFDYRVSIPVYLFSFICYLLIKMKEIKETVRLLAQVLKK